MYAFLKKLGEYNNNCQEFVLYVFVMLKVFHMFRFQNINNKISWKLGVLVNSIINY